VGEHGLLLIDRFEIKRNETGHPAATMDDVGGPAEFFDGFQGALTEKDRSQSIIIKPFFLLIMKDELALEKVLVLQKIYLQTGIGKRGDFNLKRVIVVVHGYINT
jgi:hypothetical protein